MPIEPSTAPASTPSPADAPSRAARRRLVEDICRKLSIPSDAPDSASRPAAQRLAAEACATMEGDESTRATLVSQAMDDLFGFGPIQPLLDDPSVTEVMVNRADRVYVERGGKPVRTAVTFDDDAHVLRVIDRILLPLGRKLHAGNPMLDARLPDGSRVNAVVAPVAIAGACITIRKFSKARLTLDDLQRFGSLTAGAAEFLRACVLGRLNIIVSGGTGSGKTTLLNALSGCIPEDERIVTIEDAAELKLAQDHVITLEAKRPAADGSGEVSIRELVRNALRMRPERIVVGECRGGEALDMLQAMNTGHDGSLTTLHANSPRDAISRIETMALMAGIDFPIRVIREQIGSAVQLIVHQARMRDGARRITHITEVAGMEGDKVILQELFRYKEFPATTSDKCGGALQPAGLRPQFLSKLESAGIHLAPQTFQPGERAPASSRSAA